MRLIGLDPGLRLTGWGVIEVDGNRLRHVAHGVVKVATTGTLAERLKELFDGVSAVVEAQRLDVAQVAVLLTPVERVEHRGRDAVGDAGATRPRFAHQGQHAAGRVRCAAVVVRALPEAARPAVQARVAAFLEGEVGFPDQRAVAEQPDRRRAVEAVAQAVDRGGVVGHGERRSGVRRR